MVLKIVSLSRACLDGYPVVWVQALGTALAAVDVWTETDIDGDDMRELWVSMALCVVHFVILGVIRWSSRLSLCVA